MLYASKTGDSDCQPTARQGHIREATSLRPSDSLEASVLEARLLAQQTPEEIAAKCNLPQPVIEAYTALFFDVRGLDRVRLWFKSALPFLGSRQSRGWQMGTFLKNLAVTNGSKALEEAIDLLCRLSGPTLAEGLPEPGTVDSVHELIMRTNLAFELLRNPNHLQQLQDGIDRYNLEFRSTGRVSKEATAMVVEILHKAKLSATLRKEIQRLRRHCCYVEDPTGRVGRQHVDADSVNSKRNPRVQAMENQFDVLTGKVKPTDPTPSKAEKKGRRAGNADAKPATEPEPLPKEILAAQAANLKDLFAPAHLYIAISSSIAPSVGTDLFKVYRAKLLEEAGNPTDPIEVMLIEQLALSHFHIGRLHLKSCMAEHGPLVVAYADAATRLTAEFRRSALALEDYRLKQLSRKGQAPDMAGIATVELAMNDTPEEHNGRPSRAKPKKNATSTEITTPGNEEMPEWLRKRMSSNPSDSRLAASLN